MLESKLLAKQDVQTIQNKELRLKQRKLELDMLMKLKAIAMEDTML